MLTSSPWVDQYNPLQAAEAGARTGLEARGQDISSLDAGRRLRLSYDTLMAQQENERRRSAQDAAQTQALYSLKQSQQDALSNYRQQQVADQQDRIKQAADKASAAADTLKLTHQDTAGFVEDAETMGVAKALAKNPYADKTVVTHLLTQDAQKGKDPFSRIDYTKSADRVNKLQGELDALGPMSADEDETTRNKRAMFAEEISALHRQMGNLKTPPALPQPSLVAPVGEVAAAPVQNLVNGQPIPTPATNNTVNGEDVGSYLARLNGTAPATNTTSSSVAAQPAAQAKSPPTIKNKKTGKIFVYKGDPSDIPTDKYDIVQ